MSSNSAYNFGQSKDVADLNTRLAELESQVVTVLDSGDNRFYISPTGSDVTGDGTSSNPLATLGHAIFYVTQKHRIVSGSRVIFTLKDGTYDMSSIGATFGPDMSVLTGITGNVELNNSTFNITGTTASTSIFLNETILAELGPADIVIEGENVTQRFINDCNGKGLNPYDGSAAGATGDGFSHELAGVTNAAGVTTSYDNFYHSVSLRLEGGEAYSSTGITGNDYVFVDIDNTSTRMRKIGDTYDTNWDQFTLLRDGTVASAESGDITDYYPIGYSGGNRGNNNLYSYKMYGESTAVGKRGFDTPRQLTRYSILGGHTVLGVSGASAGSATGTGPGDVTNNHALNLKTKKFLRDDKNFNVAWLNPDDTDLQHKFYCNGNFIAQDFICDQSPFKRDHGTLSGTGVDVARQIFCEKGGFKGPVLPGNTANLRQEAKNGFLTCGITSGVHPISGQSHAYYDGGQTGYATGGVMNSRFTLNPADGRSDVGLTGANGEFVKDGGIRAKKYGALLKFGNVAGMSAAVTSLLSNGETAANVASLFEISGLNVTIRNLGIVGDYDYYDDSQNQVAFDNFSDSTTTKTVLRAFSVINGGSLNLDNVGIMNTTYGVDCLESNVNMNDITVTSCRQSLFALESEITGSRFLTTGAWGSASTPGGSVYLEGTNMTMNDLTIIGTNSHGLMIRGGVNRKPEINLNYPTFLWIGQGGEIAGRSGLDPSHYLFSNQNFRWDLLPGSDWYGGAVGISGGWGGGLDINADGSVTTGDTMNRDRSTRGVCGGAVVELNSHRRDPGFLRDFWTLRLNDVSGRNIVDTGVNFGPENNLPRPVGHELWQMGAVEAGVTNPEIDTYDDVASGAEVPWPQLSAGAHSGAAIGLMPGSFSYGAFDDDQQPITLNVNNVISCWTGSFITNKCQRSSLLGQVVNVNRGTIMCSTENHFMSGHAMRQHYGAGPHEESGADPTDDMFPDRFENHETPQVWNCRKLNVNKCFMFLSGHAGFMTPQIEAGSKTTIKDSVAFGFNVWSCPRPLISANYQRSDGNQSHSSPIFDAWGTDANNNGYSDFANKQGLGRMPGFFDTEVSNNHSYSYVGYADHGPAYRIVNSTFDQCKSQEEDWASFYYRDPGPNAHGGVTGNTAGMVYDPLIISYMTEQTSPVVSPSCANGDVAGVTGYLAHVTDQVIYGGWNRSEKTIGMFWGMGCLLGGQNIQLDFNDVSAVDGDDSPWPDGVGDNPDTANPERDTFGVYSYEHGQAMDVAFSHLQQSNIFDNERISSWIGSWRNPGHGIGKLAKQSARASFLGLGLSAGHDGGSAGFVNSDWVWPGLTGQNSLGSSVVELGGNSAASMRNMQALRVATTGTEFEFCLVGYGASYNSDATINRGGHITAYPYFRGEGKYRLPSDSLTEEPSLCGAWQLYKSHTYHLTNGPWRAVAEVFKGSSVESGDEGDFDLITGIPATLLQDQSSGWIPDGVSGGQSAGYGMKISIFGMPFDSLSDHNMDHGHNLNATLPRWGSPSPTCPINTSPERFYSPYVWAGKPPMGWTAAGYNPYG